MAGYVTVDSTFFYGATVSLRAGDIYRDDDPLVKDHPDWFTPLEDSGFVHTTVPPTKPTEDKPVEKATAEPGEKRATKRAST
jgi:hypothetical protein